MKKPPFLFGPMRGPFFPAVREIQHGLHLRVRGRVKVMVVDPATGTIEQERPWQHNLWLDAGLNRLPTYCWCDLWAIMAIGDGNTPTIDDGGAVTASQAGTTVTLSETFAGMAVNRLIVWTSGERAKVVSGSGTSWVVDRAQTVSATTFAVYRIEQTALANEITSPGRTNTYLPGVGNCGHSAVANEWCERRTFDTAAMVADKNISEIGFSHTGTPGANLNVRILLAGGAVTVVTGKQLRVVYDFYRVITPAVPTAISASITGLPVYRSCTADIDTDKITLAGHGFSDTEKVVFATTGTLPTGLVAGTTYYVRDKTTNDFKVAATPGGAAIDLTGANGSGHTVTQPTDATELIESCGLSYVLETGATQFNTTGASQLEPASTAPYIRVSIDGTALGTFGTNPAARASLAAKAATIDSYVSNSFQQFRWALFGTTEANSTAIRAFVYYCATYYCHTVLFAYKQIKLDTCTLKITYRLSWDRDIP
jgi:hypothetical protein